MAPPVLLSRGFDPLLGVFTGVFAYYLYETNPRTAFPPDQQLTALVRWKWLKWKTARDERLDALEKHEQALFQSSRDTDTTK
ncbi:hypothetical protein BV22DRAFT_1017982 [Leucogyrophana mollusca]|uniref:Uncharacterized protein n=1 Tax=Leucogyrophana mollusca TaxID=85980 RepID=A0ACB8BA40_9AGAM|nr:hypothetical protein BV22DRAFT_1017982 [Leucogyrophana mollusca]